MNKWKWIATFQNVVLLHPKWHPISCIVHYFWPELQRAQVKSSALNKELGAIWNISLMWSATLRTTSKRHLESSWPKTFVEIFGLRYLHLLESSDTSFYCLSMLKYPYVRGMHGIHYVVQTNAYLQVPSRRCNNNKY